jgi:predicted DNA-binding transcriptional regulator AlpA
MSATMTPTPPGLDAVLGQIRDALTAAADPPVLLTADEAARLLSISRASFFRGVSAGSLPAAVASPGGPRYRHAEVLRACERMRPAA